MLRLSTPLFQKRALAQGIVASPVDWARVHKRRQKLEQRRIQESQWQLPPVDPTPEMARSLYRAMLKEGAQVLVLTDKEYFRRKVREEFEVTARRTSARVRGMMYEKGKWMLKHKLGGIV